MAHTTSKNICGTSISLCRGDITRQTVDVIVNAANSSLLGGGGVDGAIHKGGGPSILEECLQIRKMQGGCPTGSAVITGGGNLPAQYVIHTVGPVWRGGSGNEAQLLASAYRSSLALALDYALKTIAFPSISTGAYGYPLEEASAVALGAVSQFLNEKPKEMLENSQLALFDEIRFVLFDGATLTAYQSALDRLG
jgi:O-acetyl-ADP-ribose deacetylase (regulator of RNase III)